MNLWTVETYIVKGKSNSKNLEVPNEYFCQGARRSPWPSAQCSVSPTPGSSRSPPCATTPQAAWRTLAGGPGWPMRPDVQNQEVLQIWFASQSYLSPVLLTLLCCFSNTLNCLLQSKWLYTTVQKSPYIHHLWLSPALQDCLLDSSL